MTGKNKKILLFAIAFFLIISLNVVSADFTNETDEFGNVIIKDDSGEIIANVPLGYTYTIEDNRFIFINEEVKSVFPPLKFMDYEISSAEKGAEIIFSKEEGNYVLNLKGEGNIKINDNLINNVKDAMIKIDESGKVIYADFVSFKKEFYTFEYQGKEFFFNVNEGGKVHFDPKEGTITTESVKLTLNDFIFESDKTINFELDDLGVLEEAHLDGKGHLLLDDGITDISFDEGLNFYNYKKKCEDSPISCVRVLQRQRKLEDGTKIFTKELDVSVSKGNSVEISSKDGVYDNINLMRKNNKVEDGNILVSLIKEDGESFNLKLDETGAPLITNLIGLTTDFQSTGVDDEGEIHQYYLVDEGKMIMCSDCETLGYSKRLLFDEECFDIFMYSGGNKKSRENLKDWLDESSVCYQLNMFRYGEKPSPKNLIRMFNGENLPYDSFYSSYIPEAFFIEDLPTSEVAEVIISSACRTTCDPSSIEKDYELYPLKNRLKDYSSFVEFEKRRVEVDFGEDWETYKKTYEGNLEEDLKEEYLDFKKNYYDGLKEFEEQAALYVSHLLKSNPNAVHLGFSTRAPDKGPGGAEVTKRFFEKVGIPENLRTLTGEEKKDLWIEAGKEILSPGVYLGVYYKDNKGIWKWTDGRRTVTIPKEWLK